MQGDSRQREGKRWVCRAVVVGRGGNVGRGGEGVARSRKVRLKKESVGGEESGRRGRGRAGRRRESGGEGGKSEGMAVESGKR